MKALLREYEKESSGDRAKKDWFSDDDEAWGDAMQQIQRLSDRWNLWLLAQSAERTVSVRILGGRMRKGGLYMGLSENRVYSQL